MSFSCRKLCQTLPLYYRKVKVKPSPGTASTVAAASSSAPTSDIKEVVGTGRITSSLTTIHGHQTSFMNELTPGDASMCSSISDNKYFNFDLIVY